MTQAKQRYIQNLPQYKMVSTVDLLLAEHIGGRLILFEESRHLSSILEIL